MYTSPLPYIYQSRPVVSGWLDHPTSTWEAFRNESDRETLHPARLSNEISVFGFSWRLKSCSLRGFAALKRKDRRVDAWREGMRM